MGDVAASGSATTTSPTAGQLAEAFVLESRSYLSGEYVPKIRRCLRELREEDVWWRPNPRSNSVGNLVLHLCGNARQWVLHGVCGQPDIRERSTEFAARDGWGLEELREHMDRSMADVDAGLRALEATAAGHPALLTETRTIQGNTVTVMRALYHVVEHFSTHTGQILWITKARTDQDLGFWVVEGGTATPNW